MKLICLTTTPGNWFNAKKIRFAKEVFPENGGDFKLKNLFSLLNLVRLEYLGSSNSYISKSTLNPIISNIFYIVYALYVTIEFSLLKSIPSYSPLPKVVTYLTIKMY